MVRELIRGRGFGEKERASVVEDIRLRKSCGSGLIGGVFLLLHHPYM